MRMRPSLTQQDGATRGGGAARPARGVARQLPAASVGRQFVHNHGQHKVLAFSTAPPSCCASPKTTPPPSPPTRRHTPRTCSTGCPRSDCSQGHTCPRAVIAWIFGERGRDSEEWSREWSCGLHLPAALGWQHRRLHLRKGRNVRLSHSVKSESEHGRGKVMRGKNVARVTLLAGSLTTASAAAGLHGELVATGPEQLQP